MLRLKVGASDEADLKPMADSHSAQNLSSLWFWFLSWWSRYSWIISDDLL